MRGTLVPYFGSRLARTPDPQRHHPVGDHATHPQRVEITEVVGVEMADEDLVEVVVGDLEGRDPLGRAGADVEQELVAVAQLHEPAGCGLLGASVGHTGATGGDAHLVRSQRLGPGVVDLPFTEWLDGEGSSIEGEAQAVGTNRPGGTSARSSMRPFE